MKSYTSTITLIAVATQWIGCTSPKTQTSENLPSQLPGNPIELHADPALETGELAGEPGIEGLPGQPVAEGIVLPGDTYTLPDIDFVNLKDTPPEERSLDAPRVRDPEDWKPENLITPPGATGETGEPEKIVLQEDTEPADPAENPLLAENRDTSEEGHSEDPLFARNTDTSDEGTSDPASDSSPHTAELSPELTNLLANSPLSARALGDGEASAIPVFFPEDPAQLQLGQLLDWLDFQEIEHPDNFSDALAALQWLKQRRDSEPESLGDRKNQIDQLFAWLHSTPADSADHPNRGGSLLTGSPWDFSKISKGNHSADSNPLMLSKASLWLQNPAYQNANASVNANERPSNSLPNFTPIQASSPAVRPNSSAQSLNYTATLRWLQLASQQQPASQYNLSRPKNLPVPSSDHTEALRWLQKASGKRKAPLHASILSSGISNP